MSTLLDPAQIIRQSYDEINQSVQVRSIAAGLVTQPYDNIVLTYILAGNGTGQIGTVVYKLGVVTQATLTLSYDSSDRLSSVVKS
jgi:hypothetical protein